MLIQTTIGNENWSHGQTKVHLFVCPTRAWPLEGREEHLWRIARDGCRNAPPLTSLGGSVRSYPAGNGMNQDIVGKWTDAVYDAPPGTLIKVHVTRSVRGSAITASILMHVREGAALNRIAVSAIPNPRAALREIVIEGQFDVIDLDHAERLGYTPRQMYRPTFRRERWRSMPFLIVREIEPATVAAPTVATREVENASGECVQVKRTRQRRAFDL